MPNVVEEIRLILVEAVSNNNKWWTGRLFDNGDVITLWGRVGYDGDSKTFPGAGADFLRKKEREKAKKGYSPLKTVGGPASPTAAQVKDVGNHELRQIAKSQLLKTSNPTLDRLIDRLVQANVHRITSSTQITFNSSTGLFSTPLGVVTSDGIDEARNLLVTLNSFVTSRDWTSPQMLRVTSDYLRIVPQAVGMRLNVQNLFPDTASIQKQSSVLDSLEASYQALQSQPTPKADGTTQSVEQVFRVDMDVLTDAQERRRIETWYEKSKKDMHNYGRVKIRDIFMVNIQEMTSGFETKTSPFQEVWHGTSQANCLSILKSGLKTSPPSTAAIAGKMFSNGIYGAINSSKSLGYTFGRWGQGGVGDSGWLFICEFAMGNIKTVYDSCGKPAGYDSVWAKAGRGLYNDELIVYRNSQVKVKYLLECK